MSSPLFVLNSDFGGEIVNPSIEIEYGSQSAAAHSSLIWIAVIAAISSAVVLLSLFSGFRSFPVPFDLAWQFSPIGLLQGVSEENRALESQSFFAGKFGYTWDYTHYFLKTCLIEAPFYFWCFRRMPFVQAFALMATANFLTHPLVFFFFPSLFEKYLTAALVSEAFAAGFEMVFVAWVLTRFQSLRAGLIGGAVAVLANLVSWEIGMFL